MAASAQTGASSSTVTDSTPTAAPQQQGGTAAGAAPGVGAFGGSSAGQAIGDKIKSGWNVFHGAGEALRGTVNDTADQAGEQVAGRGNDSDAPPTRSDGGVKPNQVAEDGADEMRRGVAGVQK